MPLLKLFPKSLPITINPFFVFLAVMIGWLNSGTIQGTIIWSIVVFFSVLFHEFGHALIGLLYRQSPAITLFGMGGMTERRTPTKLTPGQEFLLVFNGPLFGFILAFAAKFALDFVPEKMEVLTYALSVTYIVNLFWTILNLLPIQPMDGGKISLIFFESLFGIRGLKVSMGLSFILSGLFAIFFLYLNQVLVGALFILFAFDGYRAFIDALRISSADHDVEIKKSFQEGEELLALHKPLMARDKFLQVQKTAGRGIYYSKSAIRLAEIAYTQGEYQECLNDINSIKGFQKDVGILKLKQKALMQLERYKESLKVGEELFVQVQDSEVAAKNALLSARLKDTKATLGWLKWLKKESNPTFSLLINNGDFKFLQDNPEFKQLIAQ